MLSKGSIGIILITLLAFLVRVMTACWTGLTADEANGAMIAVEGSWMDMVEHLREDGNPPLLYAIVRLYASVFGHMDLSLRLLALGIGTLQIPLSYFICRRMLSTGTSLQVALMLALCPPLVRFSTMLRSYGLISIFGLISAWSCLRVLTTKKGLGWPLLYAVSTTALVMSHYWGAFVPIGQTIMVALALSKGWIGRTEFKRWFLGAVTSLALFAPWVPILHFQVTHVLSAWDAPPIPSVVLMYMASFLFIGAAYDINPAIQMSLFIADLFLLALIFTPRVLRTESFDGRLWKAKTVAGYLCGLAVTVIVPTVRDRYMTPFTPLMSILWVTSFQQTFPHLKSGLARALPVLIWLPLWLPQLGYLATEPETSGPAVAAEINQNADASKDMVVIAWPPIGPAITFYLKPGTKVVSSRDPTGRKFDRYVDMMKRLRDPESLPELFKHIDQTLAAGGKIWLVEELHQIQYRDFSDNELVQRLSYMEAEEVRMDQIRTWLSIHAEQMGRYKIAPGRDWSILLTVFRPHQKTEQSAPAPP